MAGSGTGPVVEARNPSTAVQGEESVFRTTSPDGASIGAWRSGTGRPLVLVHGTTADHTRWRAVLSRLEPRVSVFAVDRRGRGASGDTDDYAIEREFADIASIPGARVVTFPGQQHIAMDTVPDRFAAEVLAFLDDGADAPGRRPPGGSAR